MGFMTEKKEKETTQQEQAAIRAAVTEAVSAAVTPLQQEIGRLSGEVQDLKKAAEKPNAADIEYNLSDHTTKQINRFVESTAAGVDSYKMPIYALFGIMIVVSLIVAWNTYKLNETAKNIDWKYDTVTGILSGDRHYWWDGENFEASRKSPEAKQLQQAVEQYKKINEQMKK